MITRRRRSEPAKYTDDQLDYDDDVFYGSTEDRHRLASAPVQVKKPNRCFIRRPSDKLHLAVWDNDPAKVQRLVLKEGNFFPNPALSGL